MEYAEYPVDQEPWCFGNITRDDAIQQLKVDGDYLVRYSSNTKGYVTTLQFEGKNHHVKIQELRDQVRMHEISLILHIMCILHIKQCTQISVNFLQMYVLLICYHNSIVSTSLLYT